MLLPYKRYIRTMFYVARLIENAPTKYMDATDSLCKAYLLKSHQFSPHISSWSLPSPPLFKEVDDQCL